MANQKRGGSGDPPRRMRDASERDFGQWHETIAFVPGGVGYGTVGSSILGMHVGPTTRVIGVARKRYMLKTSGEKVHVLAHEILHHFLKKNINPGAGDPGHDTEGIMLSYLVSTNKLGCRTVKALLRAGVDKSEIYPEYIIKKGHVH